MQKFSQERYADRNFQARSNLTNNATANRASQAAYDIYEDISNIKHALSEATQHAKGRAGEILSNSMDTMRNTTSNLRSNATHYITKEPLKALGIAAIAGILLGALIRK